MKASEAKAVFPSEAELCDCFIASVKAVGGWTVYPETAGFDILCVYDNTGHQLGVEAKLQLNAKVADQILPDQYMGYTDGVAGPDFRAVIVPCITDASAGIEKMLGILGVMVWTPDSNHRYVDGEYKQVFDFLRSFSRHNYTNGNGELVRANHRNYDTTDGPLTDWDLSWHDWNPPKRCELPAIVPCVRAGIPAPIQLTPWKIGALKVLADLELDGFVTAKSVRECGVDARRFCASDGWLAQLGGGRWGRGRIPAFDQQHPEAYAEVLATARAARAQAA